MEFRAPTVTPLRQRMLDDMRLRDLKARTQAGYSMVHSVRVPQTLPVLLSRGEVVLRDTWQSIRS